MTRDGYLTTDDGVRLYFQCIGNGHAALIVPNGPPFVDSFQMLSATHTIIAFDARNRGRSTPVTDPDRLNRALELEVDDIEAVRRYFAFETIDLLGHSYAGVIVVLYAMRHASHVGRIIQLAPPSPNGGITYPLEDPADAAILQTVLDRIGTLAAESSGDPEEQCRRFWNALRPLYVVNADDVSKLDGFQRCGLETERSAFQYFSTYLMPQLHALSLGPDRLAQVLTPVLTIHGRRDRSAPYAAGCAWVRDLANARLLSVENAGHMPWIEAPEEVLDAAVTFLAGEWPAAVEVS
jgi:proline iminopeptidase